MADSAFQTMYRQEFIAGFEKRVSLTRHTVVTETEINGNSAVFLVADSGGATAVTRGINGDIPTRPDNLTQNTATLQEWHDVPERTRFNIYTSQGDGRRIMQETSMAVINRKIDADIHSVLVNGTVAVTTDQTTAPKFLASLLEAKAKLGVAYALEEEPFALVTSAFYAKMMQVPQFTSSDYINLKPFEGASKSRAFNWLGVNWIVDDGLPGAGTATAPVYMYARNAVGHACDMERVSTLVGYDEKNDKSWVRTSTFMGSKSLQAGGIAILTNSDTDYSLA